MPKSTIITLPHPSLRKKSATLTEVDQDVLDLIQRMKDATIDWGDHREHEVGVAMAAVQINDLRRVVIIRRDFDDKSKTDFDTFINPEIVKTYGDPVYEYEGCLSVKDMYGKVPRYPKVKLKAMDEHGKSLELTVAGFAARVFQHEIDHTNGFTYADRIGADGDFRTIDEHGKVVPLDEAPLKKMIAELKLQ